ncbi:hypothetical protein ACFV9C_25510 [Kribbella sp. NPDC059898]|uniref:hypothetical protein n=1 Tax=Kribbella sp. NPDC059898 TaxID=3346995 RepID=UPI0036511AD3
MPPSGWKEYPAGHASGLSVVFLAPAVDPAAKFVDNINVVITPAAKDLRSTVAESKQAYPRIFTHYRLVVDEPAIANGRDAYLVGGTFEREGLELGNLQLFVIAGAKQYTITFTSPAASFPRLRRLAQASLLSFRLA